MNKPMIIGLSCSESGAGTAPARGTPVARPRRGVTREGAPSLRAGRSENLTIQLESRRRRMQFDSKGKLWRMLAILALGSGCTAALSDEVTDRAKDPDLWAAPGGDQALTRHSRLKDISTANVKGLQMVWSQSSGTLRGHEGQPLVVTVGNTPMMYMESGWPNIIQALDLTDPDHPREVWNYKKATNRDDSAVPRACCDTVNRGPSYADGKLVFGTLDGFVIARDAKSGKEVWECHSTGSDKDVCLTPATNKAHPEYGKAGSDAGIHSYPGDEWQRATAALPLVAGIAVDAGIGAGLAVFRMRLVGGG